jgi:hypothetical protein
VNIRTGVLIKDPAPPEEEDKDGDEIHKPGRPKFLYCFCVSGLGCACV